jgi:predicted transcriptional regulator
MDAHVGDVIKIESPTVGRAPRLGRVLESIDDCAVPHYRVGWQDGQETLYYPGLGGHVVDNSEQVVDSPPSQPRRLLLSGTLSRIMSGAPARVGAGATLRQVASLLSNAPSGAVAVFDGDEAIGLVAEQDVVSSLAAGADPDEIWAADIVAASPVWGSPDDGILESAELMATSGLRQLPLRAEGEIVGVVSLGDVVSAILGLDR